MDISSSDPQPPSLQSICHIRASDLYPKATLQIEDTGGGNNSTGEEPPLTIPFSPVCGEAVAFLGRTADGIVALSNYRLFLQLNDGANHNVPLGLIEQVEVKDIFYLHVLCKDARSQKLVFLSNDVCLEWFRRILNAVASPKSIDHLFAFSFYAWSSEEGGEIVTNRLKRQIHSSSFRNEVERLQFDVQGAWRITTANEKGNLCCSYPRQLLVPSCITDQVLDAVARFRSYRRVPAVVWRHTGNGAVLARCSQPEVGFWCHRSKEDEDLLKAIADACACDRGLAAPVAASDFRLTPVNESVAKIADAPPSLPAFPSTVLPSSVCSTPPIMNGTSNGGAYPLTDCNGGDSSDTASVSESLPDEVELPLQGKKLLIMDARSYTTAVANRARGGGCECPEYYPSCEIQFMNLANIHSIRKSFHSLRALCASAADQLTWLSLLEGTRWLQHMSGLLRAAVTVAEVIDNEGRPVVVHCSDGWDRTPQIVALAEVLLDPYYRTIEGFRVLCEREWLEFGHKFADRCGHSVGGDDYNERCPVFLQWLDCIHQLLEQFSIAFEFSDAYLVKLVQHTYSNLFGTFLCNSSAEREMLGVADRTFSVWQFLEADCFKNHLYLPQDKVLRPSCNVRDLKVWSELYLGSSDRGTSILSSGHMPIPHTTATTTHSAPGSVAGGSTDKRRESVDQNGEVNGLVKTRSYDDIIAACEERDCECPVLDQPRRCSDSSINIDLKFVNGTSSHIDNNEEVSEVDGQIRDSETIVDVNEKALDLVPSQTLDAEIYSSKRMPDSRDYSSGTTPVDNFDEPAVNGEDYQSGGAVTPQPMNLVDSNDVQTQMLGQMFDGGGIGINGESDNGASNDSNDNDSEVSSPRALLPKAVVHSMDALSAQAVHSVDSSTDTLVAPDQLAGVTNGMQKLSLNEVEPSSSSPSSCFIPRSQVMASTNGPLPSPLSTFPLLSDPLDVVPENDSTVPSAGDMCRVCANSRKFLADSHRDHSESSSRYSTPPLHSRTPSGCYPATPNEDRSVLRPLPANAGLPVTRLSLDDVDGLSANQSDVQIRVQQVVAGYKTRIQELERDLHMTRMALTQQVCHQCNHGPPDRNDDARSLPESGCSGEPASGGESLPSDVSWEALEDPAEPDRVLWVPDHAASWCTACRTEFSVLRRRHHCRKCGQIFCADCSENAVPVPSQQLYNPVRVCTSCFASLHCDPAESLRRNILTGNSNGHVTFNGHGVDAQPDMAESALTFASNSYGFSCAAAASSNTHTDTRQVVAVGAETKLSGHQQPSVQSRKSATAFV